MPPPGLGPGGPGGPGAPPGPSPPPESTTRDPFPTRREERQAKRLRDFTLPPLPKHSKPTASWIEDEAKRRVTYWQGRNEEIDADLAIYFMDGAVEVKTTGKGGEEVIRRVTGRAMVDKVANMVDRQKDRIQCTPRSQTQEYVDAAQDCEDWLYDMRREQTMRSAMNLDQSASRTQAWFAAAMGWVASRECLAPGKAVPIMSQYYDARHCYPGPGDANEVGQLKDHIYYEETDYTTFIAANPKWADRAALKELEGEDKVEVTWYEDTLYSIVIINGQRLTRGEEEEHDYGFCPWLLVPIGGTPIWDKDRRRHHGAGVLRALRASLKYEDRFYSQLATSVAQDANPTRMSTYNSSLGGAPKEVDLRPGAQNSFDTYKGEGFQPYTPAIRGDLLAPMRDMLDEENSRAGVDSMLLGGNRVPPNSGFQFTVMRFNAEDVVQPITRGIITHRQWQHRLWLQLVLVGDRLKLLEPNEVGEVGEEPTTGIRYRRQNRAPGATSPYAYSRGRAATSVYSVLTPKSISLHGVQSEVMLSNLTPQDMAQIGQVVTLLIGQKVISRRTAWNMMAGMVEDPELENMRIIYEAYLYEDPDVLRNVLGPMAANYFDPNLGAYLEKRTEDQYERAQQEFQQQMQLMQQQVPPGLPPGMPPGMDGMPPPPGPGGPPMPGVGLDSTVLPPDMQATTGMPGAGDDAAIQALLASLAQGGGLPG
jgi:hypothetical protein